MKINKIELYNIGSYEGLNEFDIRGQENQGHIIVVGGKNGAGKTTLFTAIKLCLYGFKEAGYQAMNSFYKKDIKRLVNDKAKAENNAYAYVLLDLEIVNGQEWDNYVLKREWHLEGTSFETFNVYKNGNELDAEEKVDFDNFLMNLLPPELFELYFFDGEQIADFFLEDNNNERIKNAFLTICGYDTFEIIYKNFKRVSTQQGDSDDPTKIYLDAEDALYDAEVKLKRIVSNIERITEEIELEASKLKSLEAEYSSGGGIETEEWDKLLQQIKDEEKLREELNARVKNAVNDLIPYIILNRELKSLLERMNKEKSCESLAYLSNAIDGIIPEVLAFVSRKHQSLSQDIQAAVLEELRLRVNTDDSDVILHLSQNEYGRLAAHIEELLLIDKKQILRDREEIDKSRVRSENIRATLDKVNVEGAATYITEKERCINRRLSLIEEREIELAKKADYLEEVDMAKVAYTKASKELDKHYKTQSVTAMTGQALKFMKCLQKRLYDSEIQKVKKLFMDKMHQLMRKEQFIDRIEIDDDFNVHVYKTVSLDVRGIREKMKSVGIEMYKLEYGDVHCEDLLNNSKCCSFEEFLNKRLEMDKLDLLMEFNKATMSKGEKQVFIMALYWSIMQLCKKDIPFIIDTPFARIDTEHREHITEHFFKELKGQIFIFSTDEEITDKHMDVIGDKLGGKFLIENINNTRTSITAGKYFGE